MVAMVKSAGPPCFSQCYVCHREFGTRSIELHEPKCLARWHKENKKLPKSQQRTPPVKKEQAGVVDDNGNTVSNLCDSLDLESNEQVSIELIPLDAGTWPKMKKSKSNSSVSDENIARPQTATLERPRVLDVAHLQTLDMSLTRKGLLSISNLCKLPPRVKGVPCSNVGPGRRKNYLHRKVSGKQRVTQIKKEDEKEDESWEDEESSEAEKPKNKKMSRQNKVTAVPALKKGNDRQVSNSTSSVPSKSNPVRRGLAKKTRTFTKVTSVKKVEEVFVGPPSKVPLPCNSCGRPEHPERFHSHPVSPPKPKTRNAAQNKTDKEPEKTISKPVIKSSVQKPVAIRFRSSSSIDKGNSNEKKKGALFPSKSVSKSNNVEAPKINPVKRANVPARQSKSPAQKPVSQKPAQATKEENNKTGKQTPQPPKPTVVVHKKNIMGDSSTCPENADIEILWKEGKLKLEPDKAFIIIDDRETPAHGPRTLMCYLCGREFGTTSYPLHEPRCLEKWQRENAKLPSALQRPLPAKPEKPMTVEEWNVFAWQASQAQLVPCEWCGRTFAPDRLQVHLRGCSQKKPGYLRSNASNSSFSDQKSTETAPSSASSNSSSAGTARRPTVYCYICGRPFGTKSIAIHEPQCLKKWRIENEKLPPKQRLPEPEKPAEPITGQKVTEKDDSQSGPSKVSWNNEPCPNNELVGSRLLTTPTHSNKGLPDGRPPAGSSSSARSEDDVYKFTGPKKSTRTGSKGNRKIPVLTFIPAPVQNGYRTKARSEDDVYKFTATGELDFKATFDAIWQAHLEQLMPCKNCGRTFFPDRLEVHQRSCKPPANKR